MGKDQELLQAVKTEDLITVQKLLQRPKPGKANQCHPVPGCWQRIVLQCIPSDNLIQRARPDTVVSDKESKFNLKN
ncbi:Caskin-1 [Acipenser ruthenus]|uniref:Caskin-1 n=1 Tax=Acipenser ruthenus TaxID=7906 RepID=A0A662YZQ5_ACIRT|nr:Caskin-1 [Acipenser ruthenus]